MAKVVRLKTKGVSFNVADDGQRELFEHCEGKSNFSAYVKSLILRDILGEPVVPKVEPESQEADVNSFI
ncbi:hypothetical protein SAMN05216389_12125 [Oceanobacillus limi]|uniref:Uncharacterized protein n=1 Tax=Oceanobacillus limi TaxID=930131 RepID=A0A1I0GEX9_9BACI|nr:hypothetical protein [Oceanobacillus limi]SET69510.1 hypothetical protein SAMN05216389_12125 [Oceanobacillus limi]